MYKKEIAIQVLEQQKLLPLYYHDSEEVSLTVLKALYKAGGRIVEYTNRGPNALKNFKKLRSIVDTELSGMLLGIGTIKNVKQCNEYINAGADFIVCPIVKPEVAEVTHKAGLLWIPGCMTPTEIALAEESGATHIKLFPGNILGPSYVTAIKELFPSIRFMPTGGVEPEVENLKAWFKAGVVAVGMGSKLITKQGIEQNNFEAITSNTRNALQLIEDTSRALDSNK